MNINKHGLQQIHAFLAENHNLGGDHFDESMLHAWAADWAADAEYQWDHGNGATIEIRSQDSIHGYPVCFVVSDKGVDL